MLRITLLSGEDLTSIPCAELSDVQALKQRLHHQHGLPPRFRQRLLHEGNILDDAFELDSPMDLQVLTLPFSEASDTQRDRLYEASGSGPAAEAGEMAILKCHHNGYFNYQNLFFLGSYSEPEYRI